MKRRIISFLLLASMAMSFAACNSGGNDKKDTTDTKPISSVEDTLPAGIEKQNYNGDVNILMPEWGLYKNYFEPGDDLTDIMNKALFERETKIEEHLDVNITYEYVDGGVQDILTYLSSAATTNDDLYQIVLAHCIYPNADLIMGGYLTDMNEMNIDFSADWFNVKTNDSLSTNGMQFFCVSDWNIPDPNMFLFNKEMIKELNLEDPYQLVRDGKWTLDKLSEMASVATTDNGDTIWDVNDTYGFSCPTDWFSASFIFGADIPLVEKNEDGDFYFAFDNERSYTLMEKLDALINGPDTYVFPYGGLYGEAEYVDKALPIESGRCLFTQYTFNQLHTIRNVELDFGILPYPKLDEEQEDYISNDWSGLTAVPISLSEDSYEMVGDVIELFAYYSEEDVIPTYIDVVLGTKLSRDDDSKEMIDLIFDTCIFNAGMNYLGSMPGTKNALYSVAHMIIDGKQNNLASFLATNGPAAESSIEEFNDAVKALDN